MPKSSGNSVPTIWEHFVLFFVDDTTASLLKLSARIDLSIDGDCMQVNAKLPARISPPDQLRGEYLRRREKNPQYSLRAFARHLAMTPGRLSEILANKRRISPKLGAHIAERLLYAPDERESFLAAIRRSKMGESAAGEGVPAEVARYQLLEFDTFSAIADWYHFAILSLMETVDFPEEPRLIAARLGISAVEAREALARLERLGLAHKPPKQGWQPTYKNLTTTSGIPSAALRKGHTQILAKATAAIEEVALECRDITTIMCATSPAKVAGAKELIKDFRRRLSSYLEDADKSEVYCFSAQLIPLSKTTRKKKVKT